MATSESIIDATDVRSSPRHRERFQSELLPEPLAGSLDRIRVQTRYRARVPCSLQIIASK